MSEDAKIILGVIGILVTVGTIVPLVRYLVIKYFDDIKKMSAETRTLNDDKIAELKRVQELQWNKIDEHHDRIKRVELVHQLLKCEDKINGR